MEQTLHIVLLRRLVDRFSAWHVRLKHSRSPRSVHTSSAPLMLDSPIVFVMVLRSHVMEAVAVLRARSTHTISSTISSSALKAVALHGQVYFSSW